MHTHTESFLSAFHLFPALPKEIRDAIWKFSFPGPRIIELEAAGILRIIVKFYALDPFDDDSSSCSYPNWKLYEVHEGPSSEVARRDGNERQTETPFHPPRSRGRSSVGAVLGGSRIPEILHACHESRALAMSVFEYCLSVTPNVSDNTRKWEIYPSLEPTTRPIVIPGEMATPGFRIQPTLDTIYWSIGSRAPEFLRTNLAHIQTHNVLSIAIPASPMSPELRNLLFVGKKYSPIFRGLQELFLVVEERLSEERRQIVEHSAKEMFQEIQTFSTKAMPTINVLDTKELLDLPRWDSTCRWRSTKRHSVERGYLCSVELAFSCQ